MTLQLNSWGSNCSLLKISRVKTTTPESDRTLDCIFVKVKVMHLYTIGMIQINRKKLCGGKKKLCAMQVFEKE